jgi:hypothetical protein
MVRDMKKIYRPHRVERMSPERYVRLAEARGDLIKKSRFVAPELGDNSFGHFEVEYKEPVLVADYD